MSRYGVVLELDPDERVYVVTVPALPGCFMQGRTVVEALARAREAIAGHVAALRARGEEVPIETAPPILPTVDVDEAAD